MLIRDKDANGYRNLCKAVGFPRRKEENKINHTKASRKKLGLIWRINPFTNVSNWKNCTRHKHSSDEKKRNWFLECEYVICSIWASHGNKMTVCVYCIVCPFSPCRVFALIHFTEIAINAGHVSNNFALQSHSDINGASNDQKPQFKCNNFHCIYRNYYRHLHSINLPLS